MDIFDAIMRVRLGQRCSTIVGDTLYIIFLRELENINYTPPKQYAGLGVIQIKEDKMVSITEFPPQVMCNTQWRVSGVEDEIAQWLAFQAVPGIEPDETTKQATKLMKRALKKLRKYREKRRRTK